MKMLSIIVPIYNVKAYLKKCVDSLLQQDYDNYEIILVDDGSTDGSGELADELAAKSKISNPKSKISNLKSQIKNLKSPITVLHQPNAGLSAARNTGILAAKGEYIEFLDSDDFLQPNMLGALMAQIERDNLDVLRFRYQHVHIVNGSYEAYHPYKTDPYMFDDYTETPTDGITFLNERMGTACYAAMFILRTELARKELFTRGIYFEDTDWLPRMLMQAKRVGSTPLQYYNYLMREGSITHAVSREKQLKLLNDKMRLVKTMLKCQQMENEERRMANGDWFDRMIAATVVSISGILATDFWNERKAYLQDLKSLGIFPLSTQRVNKFIKRKIRLLNMSPYLAVILLHMKNSLFR